MHLYMVIWYYRAACGNAGALSFARVGTSVLSLLLQKVSMVFVQEMRGMVKPGVFTKPDNQASSALVLAEVAFESKTFSLCSAEPRFS